MRLLRGVLITLLLLVSGIASAAPPTPAPRAGVRPVKPPASTSEEDRYGGVEFQAGAVTEALLAATEFLHVPIDDAAGTDTVSLSDATPLCVEYDAQLMVFADQVTCVCFVNRNLALLTIAAPTGDEGCTIANTDGRDGLGACELVPANTPRWVSPDYTTVRARVGAADGMCTVGTSTTSGLGRELHYPCNDTWECTATVGSGTCSTTSYTCTGQPCGAAASTKAVNENNRYADSCAFALVRPAAAATLHWSLVR